MSFNQPQFLYIGNGYGRPTEVINGARLSENMLAAVMCGTRFSNVLEDGGCPALTYEPCTTNATTGQATSWEPVDFGEEAAPWYNGTDASRDAMGFYIEDWTGLDGAHHARSVTGVGNNQGGARFGPQSHNHRVMKLNVLIHGRNAEACNYLFRWLEQTLLDGCGCGTQQLWFREFDPGIDPNDIERGLARITGVALIDGPTIEAPPAPQGECYIRRTSFTLAAGDPCIYRISEFADTEDFDSYGADFYGDPIESIAGPTYWVGQGFQVSTVSPSFDYGQAAPIVTISSATEVESGTGRLALPDLRIVGYADPNNVGFARADQAMKIGELVLSGTSTSGLEIVVNMAERSIRYRDIGSFGSWRNGSFLMGAATPGFKRWWSWDSCTPGFVVVEPKYVGLLNTAPQPSSTSARVRYYSVQIDLTSRFGCH